MSREINIESTARGYRCEIQHRELNEFRTLADKDRTILIEKVRAQFDKWDDKWKRVKEKNAAEKHKNASVNNAARKTQEAQEELGKIENILANVSEVDVAINFEDLKNKTSFLVPEPIAKYIEHSIEPNEKMAEFIPKFSVVDYLFKALKEKTIRKYNDLFRKKHEDWVKETENIDKKNIEHKKQYEKMHLEWENAKAEFIKKQKEDNLKIEVFKKDYLEKNKDATIKYCEIILENSEYPDCFPENHELDYSPESKILIVEYALPSLANMPTVSEVKYVASKDEEKETLISESKRKELFDSTIYKIVLRTIYELFKADIADGLDAINFNGWVNAVNLGTGKQENTCIVSIQAQKKSFLDVELKNVDPRECFKRFKGVGSSKLSGITAIKPILQISREDKRFIEARNIEDGLENCTNLAAMDWEDFEHLVRQVFEKEFSANGGEVKITQASKDGGVDAIAFDPDPIRGGKIVIQAKRYTNVVGVSAVRDLYGTVMNEGATKGILVTTAEYGPDSYEFAKDKPITLMNGANLLYLLEKHGHKAKIDLKEAKKMMGI